MDIRGMHYDFKQKLNKIDSHQYTNLKVPEIDWKLNEAIELFIKNIAQPRFSQHLGFERNQRSIDDIRTIVYSDIPFKKLRDAEIKEGDKYPRYTVFELPEEYMFYVTSKAIISKIECEARVATVKPQQQEDLFEESPFDKSSFKWGHVNIIFTEEGIIAFTDGTFKIDELKVSFIKRPKYIHNSQDFLPTKQYKLPDGTLLKGKQDCELPEQTHREIVDIAVLLVTGELQIPDYQIKQSKLSLNQII